MIPCRFRYDLFPEPATLRSLSLASVLSHSDNRQVSGFATLRPNPSLSLRTSDTRQTLSEIEGETIER